ncbi:MAG: O-antigen ligase family protein [Nitrospirae bacterium]|nr:O-antigen ligase family protein [Nitrospirota bacterium]
MNDRIPIFAPIIIISFLGMMLATISVIKSKGIRNPFAIANIILFLYGATTLLYTQNLEHSTVQLFIVFLNACLFSLFVNSIEDEKMHRKVMWCWVISGGLQALITILLYFVVYPPSGLFVYQHSISKNFAFVLELMTGYETDGYIKRGSAFTYAHESALLMNLTLAVAIGLFAWENKLFRRLILIVISILSIAANLLAMSRGGTGVLIIMAFFIFLFTRKYNRHFFLICIIFLLSVFAIFEAQNTILNSVMRTKVSPRLLVRGVETVSSSKQVAPDRVHMWKKGFKKLKKTLFLGLGVGNFNYYLKKVHSHSLYFSFLFDFGVIGVGILISLIMSLYRCFIVPQGDQSSYMQIMRIAILGGIVAIGVHGLVDFEYKRTLIWFFLGMAIPTASLARQELQTHTEEGSA